eukprot:163240-Pleurochrysis_carterae.AAC.1
MSPSTCPRATPPAQSFGSGAELYGKEEESFVRQRAARLRRGHAAHLRLSRLHLLHRRRSHRALLAKRQLAHLPGGRGRSGRRSCREAAQCDPYRLRLRGHHGG